MENNNIFVGMPFLSVITNFSVNGDFERIHLVMERKISNREQNQIKGKSQPAVNRFWNGPDFGNVIDKHSNAKHYQAEQN